MYTLSSKDPYCTAVVDAATDDRKLSALQNHIPALRSDQQLAQNGLFWFNSLNAVYTSIKEYRSDPSEDNRIQLDANLYLFKDLYCKRPSGYS
ncbi:MAG: hypothetical protein JWM49_2027 [Microbacteriaceae bacterium]|nr:hypothetical protein [Microbacteriaceae bacterium]